MQIERRAKEEHMKRKYKKAYRYIEDPRIYAIYITKTNTLLVTTNEAGYNGLIYII